MLDAGCVSEGKSEGEEILNWKQKTGNLEHDSQKQKS